MLEFELEGHPTAARCYAWEVDGVVTAVLGEPPVESPQDAVRASIMAGSGFDRPELDQVRLGESGNLPPRSGS